MSTCAGHTRWVKAVAVMPDGQRFLSGGDDNTVRVWLLNGTLERTFTHHTSSVECLALLPDGLRFVSGSRDKTACIAYHGLALA